MPVKHINDIDTYYEVTGQGQPLVFIHGLGSNAEDWEFQVPEFGARYMVITYDLRGHGRSDKPEGPYSLPMFASDLAGLLEALGVDSAHVVGLSLGGSVAFQLAVDRPELVKSLVIVNSAPEMVMRTLVQRFAVWMRFVTIQLFGIRKMAEILGGRLFPKPEHAELRDALIERFASNDKRPYLDTVHAMVGWSVAERLDSIRCPTLVIAADQDYSPVSYKEAYVAKIPNAQLSVIEDSHHATPIEVPEKFNQVLMEFLSKQG